MNKKIAESAWLFVSVGYPIFRKGEWQVELIGPGQSAEIRLNRRVVLQIFNFQRSSSERVNSNIVFRHKNYDPEFILNPDLKSHDGFFQGFRLPLSQEDAIYIGDAVLGLEPDLRIGVLEIIEDAYDKTVQV